MKKGVLTRSFLVATKRLLRSLSPSLLQRRCAGLDLTITVFQSKFAILAREAGYKEVEHVSAAPLNQLYFADWSDGLRLPESSED